MSLPTDRDMYLLAAFLPDAQQQHLRQSAAGSEDLEARIAASDHVASLLGGLRSGLSDPASDEVLAMIALTGHQSSGVPEPMRTLFERVEADLLARPELADRYRTVRDRLTELDDADEAVRHFERVTGLPPDPQARIRILPFVRRGLSIAAGVAFLALALAVTGRLAESSLSRAIVRQATAEVSEDRAVRGAARSADVRHALVDTRRVVLGIWPTYDSMRLSKLETDLVAMLDRGAGSGSSVSGSVTGTMTAAERLDLSLQLARVRILLGDTAGARSLLERMVADAEPADSLPSAGNRPESAQDRLMASARDLLTRLGD